MTLDEYLEKVRHYSREEYFAAFGEIEQVLYKLEERLNNCNTNERQVFIENLGNVAAQFPVWMEIHILSFCVKFGRSIESAKKLIAVIEDADDNVVGEYNKLSHYWQLSTVLFYNPDIACEEVELGLTRIYRKLFDAFSRALGVGKKSYIPVEERNKELVFVFTSQVLGMEHAPTKTLLDRCYILQKHLGKKVFIINTAMQLTKKGLAPFYKLVEGEYISMLSEWKELDFKDEKFRFYQCDDIMPDLSIMLNVVNMVREYKPYYLLNIGGSDLCADVCGNIVPEVTVSTVFSRVAMSTGEYQIIDKQLNLLDRKKLQILDVVSEKVKYAPFTFSFKNQTRILSREELGMEQGKFIILVVGWRLDKEIDDEFIRCLENILSQEDKIVVAFMGKFENYENCLKKHSMLQEKSCYLGKQDDALAVMECCNLYVNPKRNGGGSSVSEALYKGVPAVTLPHGDVSVAAGEAFWVTDYKEMEQTVLRYTRDELFYKEMAQKAKERAEILTDSKSAFAPVIRAIEKELENI